MRDADSFVPILRSSSFGYVTSATDHSSDQLHADQETYQPSNKMRTTLVKFSSAANDPSRYSHKYDDSDEEAWRSFRYFGLFASFCALGFSAVALVSRSWVVGKG